MSLTQVIQDYDHLPRSLRGTMSYDITPFPSRLQPPLVPSRRLPLTVPPPPQRSRRSHHPWRASHPCGGL